MPTHGQPPALAGRTVGDRIGCDAADTPSLIISTPKPIPIEPEQPPRHVTSTPVGSVDESSDRLCTPGPSSPEPHISYSRSTEEELGNPFPITRFLPNTSSSFLKPGFRFTGLQRSDKQEYEVTVDLQHVDMDDSFLCGYLKIRGLTDQHPTLTTFFEGEIIGTKYGFITQHDDWGANEKVDITHWSRFPGFRPYHKDARRATFCIKNWPQKEYIWMRWKEHFLVPDHRIKDLAGASFEGFYYICFNQIDGSIQGTYFHAKSDRFQHLDLKPAFSPGFDFGFEFR